ncbi:Erythritol/L-threitol dehydrogenase [Porphyridium purpureum]|uniref:Erythritol/L-threitol dehydrogenase n=1 Tax=Porphyridium purpureum TaxID=35688 RepID=A0A5J4YUP4_PORPP|nr:Erythritol/L-threitol dehydrogenase [Porphyridium purpureum]|eukprot:POR0879..scf227_4
MWGERTEGGKEGELRADRMAAPREEQGRTMRAVVCRGVRDYVVENVPIPEPGRDEILVKVLRCGICAGDAKCFEGAARFWGCPDSAQKAYVETPVIPGHEFVGEIVAFGPPPVKRRSAFRTGHELSVGDRVIAEQVVPCNNCLYCQKNLRHLCLPHAIFGFKTCVNGAMAEYMIFPANALVYKIPEKMSVDEAVYIEPLSCGVHGVERAQVESDDVVVVSGCGAIGLGMICYLAISKCPAEIIALDCIDERLRLAQLCGASMVLNPRKDDVVQLVKDRTGGYGCDVYLEATGSPASVTQGLKMVRKRGRFVEYSVFKEAVTTDWSEISDTLELDLLGAHCSGNEGYAKAIETLSSGKVPIESIVTHVLPLDKVVDGIHMVNSSSDGSVKVTLDPWL